MRGRPIPVGGRRSRSGARDSGGGPRFDGHEQSPLDQCGSAGSGNRYTCSMAGRRCGGPSPRNFRLRLQAFRRKSLRRLIGMRNWCPEKERPALDAIIRAVRAKSIDCAAWPQGGARTIYASGIDGSGAQGFLIVSPVARKVQISSVLLKSGVRDAWSAPPASEREVQSTLALPAMETSMRSVSRKYFDRILRHHLQVGLPAGALPPAGLLQVAETIGHADWQPELLGLAQRARRHACGTSGQHGDAAGR